MKVSMLVYCSLSLRFFIGKNVCELYYLLCLRYQTGVERGNSNVVQKGIVSLIKQNEI